MKSTMQRSIATASLALALVSGWPTAVTAGHPERDGIGLLNKATISAMGIDATRKTNNPVRAVTTKIDPLRSLYVNEVSIVSKFEFTDVMQAIVEDSPDPKQTKDSLYQQWWNTALKSDGQGQTSIGITCDTVGPENDPERLNGFPYECPRDEGMQSKDDQNPFKFPKMHGYKALALVNRFDLATPPNADGLATDCGEYRIIFKHVIKTNFLIFEARLPNPQPGRGLMGCFPVQNFWASLSLEEDASERGDLLHDFYFRGLPGFEPVVRARHYGESTPHEKGQIRTNQFFKSPWLLREFAIREIKGKLEFVPITNKVNPEGSLFDETNIDPRNIGVDFRTELLSQVQNLSKSGLNSFSMSTSDKFNSGDSLGSGNRHNYETQAAKSPKLLKDLADHASSNGLSGTELIRRAQAMNCIGCHEFSNNKALGNGDKWPSSLGFFHQSGNAMTDADGVSRFQFSPAVGEFLKHRLSVLEAFLGNDEPSGRMTAISGTYTCENKVKSAPGAWRLVEEARINFGVEFLTPPQVIIAPNQMEQYRSYETPVYNLSKAVDTKGIDLSIEAAYTSSFAHCKVGWMAVGIAK